MVRLDMASPSVGSAGLQRMEGCAGLCDRHVLEVLGEGAERYGLAHADVVGPHQLGVGLAVDALEDRGDLPDNIGRLGLAEALADIDGRLSSSPQHGGNRSTPPRAAATKFTNPIPLFTTAREDSREGRRNGTATGRTGL